MVIIRLGVHIRRGDYATWNDGRFLYDDKQMINIIRQFILLHPNKRVVIYICGNDPKLNKQAIARLLGKRMSSFHKVIQERTYAFFLIATI